MWVDARDGHLFHFISFLFLCIFVVEVAAAVRVDARGGNLVDRNAQKHVP